MKTYKAGYLLCGGVLAALVAVTFIPALRGSASLPAAALPSLTLAGGTLLLAGAVWGRAFKR